MLVQTTAFRQSSILIRTAKRLKPSWQLSDILVPIKGVLDPDIIPWLVLIINDKIYRKRKSSLRLASVHSLRETKTTILATTGLDGIYFKCDTMTTKKGTRWWVMKGEVKPPADELKQLEEAISK